MSETRKPGEITRRDVLKMAGVSALAGVLVKLYNKIVKSEGYFDKDANEVRGIEDKRNPVEEEILRNRLPLANIVKIDVPASKSEGPRTRVGIIIHPGIGCEKEGEFKGTVTLILTHNHPDFGMNWDGGGIFLGQPQLSNKPGIKESLGPSEYFSFPLHNSPLTILALVTEKPLCREGFEPVKISSVAPEENSKVSIFAFSQGSGDDGFVTEGTVFVPEFDMKNNGLAAGVAMVKLPEEGSLGAPFFNEKGELVGCWGYGKDALGIANRVTEEQILRVIEGSSDSLSSKLGMPLKAVVEQLISK